MSDRRYRISPAANRDIDHHFGYIARDNLDAAIRFFDAFHHACAALSSQPGMGARRTFGRKAPNDLRSWPIRGFENYLVFYRPVQGGIRIVRVLHGAQNIDAIFRSSGQ